MDTTRDARLGAVAAKQHSAFSHGQAIEAGFTRAQVVRRLRARTWTQLAFHVYALAGSPPTWQQRLWASLLELGPGAVASHRSAGALMGIPGFARADVEVSIKRGLHHRSSLAVLHETSWLPPNHVTVIDGVPCTTVARFVFDIAGTEHTKRVERVFDTALHRFGLTIPATAEVVATTARRGRPGSAVMRKLLAARGEGYVPPESDLEILFIAVLTAHGLDIPEKQVWAGGSRPVGRVDFIDHPAKLIIEVQSREHHGSWMAQEEDMIRRAELAAAGYRVLEITYGMLVHEPEKVVRWIREARRAAAA